MREKHAFGPERTVAIGSHLTGRIIRLENEAPDSTEPPWLKIPVVLGWLRGAASVVAGFVEMPESSRTSYSPENENKHVFIEFLNLNLENPQEIIEFVGRFGLLTEEGLTNSREPLEFWEEVQADLHGLHALHQAIEGAKREKITDIKSLVRLAEAKYRAGIKEHEERARFMDERFQIVVMYTSFYDEGKFGKSTQMTFTDEQRNQLIRMGLENLAMGLEEEIGKTRIQMSREELHKTGGKKIPFEHSMAFEIQASDLRSYLYLQLAFLSVDSQRLGQCSCGKFFPLTRKDRVHCSDICGATTRKAN